MATFGVLIFAADNLTNPQNPGFFLLRTIHIVRTFKMATSLHGTVVVKVHSLKLTVLQGQASTNLKPTKPW